MKNLTYMRDRLLFRLLRKAHSPLLPSASQQPAGCPSPTRARLTRCFGFSPPACCWLLVSCVCFCTSLGCSLFFLFFVLVSFVSLRFTLFCYCCSFCCFLFLMVIRKRCCSFFKIPPQTLCLSVIS